ncbi:MAG: carboxypeptidase regulatory-like domain-containing protein [Bacteroidota bacterium]
MKFWIGALVLLATSLGLRAQAQFNGQVVFAQNGAAAAGWDVVLTTSPNIQRFQTRTDAEGRFRFDNLPSGLANLTVTGDEGLYVKTIHELWINAVKPNELRIEIEAQQNLGEVVVTADAFASSPESPLSIKAIGWAEMQRMPGAVLDLSKVIQSFPGILPKPSFGYAISLRGGSPSENAYRFDGIELPTINHFSIQGASGGAVSLINLDHVQNTELQSGAFGSNYGNVLSGTLSMEGRNGRSDRLGLRVSLGQTDYGATLEGPLGKKTRFTASARNSFSQYYFRLFKIPVLPAYQDAQVRVHHQIDARRDLTLLVLGGWDRYTLYPADTSASDALRYNVGYIPEGTQRTEVGGIRYRSFDDRGQWTAVLSQDRIANRAEKFNENSGLEADRQLAYASTETNQRLRVERRQNPLPLGGQLSYGASLERRAYALDLWSVRWTGTRIDTVDLADTSAYGSAAVIATWSQPIGSRLTATLGLRADAAQRSAATANPMNNLSPRLALRCLLSERWTANANVGQYSQLPPAIVQAANSAQGRTADLASALVRQLAGGVEYQNGQTYRVSIEGYYKGYSRYPYLAQDRISYANAIGTYVAVGDQASTPTSEGRAYGLEVFLQQKLKGKYWWMASYHYGKSEFLTASGSWAPSVWDTRHSGSVTAGRVWGKGWQMGVKARYSSGTPFTPFDAATSSVRANWDRLQRGIFDYSQVNSERLASFSQIDFRIDKVTARKNYSITWYLDLQNLGSNDYPLMPYLTVVRDPSSKQPVVDPNDPTRYAMQLLRSDTGRTLPTIGFILEL